MFPLELKFCGVIVNFASSSAMFIISRVLISSIRVCVGDMGRAGAGAGVDAGAYGSGMNVDCGVGSVGEGDG